METTHQIEPECPRSDATVLQVVQESDTIKRIVLQVDNAHISFKAGQWVDFFIPGVSVFTGFSMCSAPHLLEDTGRLELAIKYSDYPPTQWVHTKCKAGDKVQIRVGGSFFHESTTHSPASDLLLIAAGIGINPMYSIFQHFVHTHRERQKVQGGSTNTKEDGDERLCLLYCAQTLEELVFKDEILAMTKTCTNADVQLFYTRPNPNANSKVQDNVSGGRIQFSEIRRQISKLDKTRIQAYICGPPGFIDDMEQHCLDGGLDAHQIHYEKWW